MPAGPRKGKKWIWKVLTGGAVEKGISIKGREEGK